MHIFSRVRTPDPSRSSDARNWATETAAKVTTLTGTAVLVSHVALGHRAGSLIWSARLDSVASLSEFFDVLGSNADYRELSERGSELFVDAPADDLLDVVAAVNVGDPMPYNLVVVGQIAPGKLVEATAWGTEAGQYVGRLLGRPNIFGRAQYGPLGQVGWVLGLNDAADADHANETLNADDGYLERLDSGGHLFLPGSVTSSLTRRFG